MHRMHQETCTAGTTWLLTSCAILVTLLGLNSHQQNEGVGADGLQSPPSFYHSGILCMAAVDNMPLPFILLYSFFIYTYFGVSILHQTSTQILLFLLPTYFHTPTHSLLPSHMPRTLQTNRFPKLQHAPSLARVLRLDDDGNVLGSAGCLQSLPQRLTGSPNFVPLPSGETLLCLVSKWINL